MSLRDEHERLDDALGELGRQTASELESVGDAHLEAQHQRLLRSLDQPKPRFRFSWQAGLATALAGAAAAVLIWGLFFSPAEEMRCVGPEGVAVAQGAALENKGAPTRVYNFSEGSKLALRRGARAKLERLSPREVGVSLSAGRLEANIRSAKKRRWNFIAGPYRVLVVGTQFSIEWKANSQRFELLVKKGRVRVAGGKIAAQDSNVVAGQRLVADGRGASLSDTAAKAKPDAAPPRDQQIDAGARGDLQASKPAQKKRPRLDMSWKRLAQKGRHKEAVAAARRAGWTALTARLQASDLLLLADAARLSRQTQLAQRALLAARRRFAGKHTGRIAAYRLGRLAADQLRDHRRAARWFHTFLKEAPRSALAGDALGGEMISLQRSGDLAGAKDLARRYLARFPKGAYAAAARQLSSRP